MMERTQVKELVFGSSSLLFSAKCGIISLFISCFSPYPILAVYTHCHFPGCFVCFFKSAIAACPDCQCHNL